MSDPDTSANLPLTIRHAEPDDVGAILDLYRHLNSSERRPSDAAAQEVLTRFQAYAGSAIFLGEADGHLVASCTLIVIPSLSRGARPYALVENVVTRPDARRSGHGRTVLDAACAAAWKAGCYKVMLMTGSKEPGTLAFYEAAGFAQTKTGFQKRRMNF